MIELLDFVEVTKTRKVSPLEITKRNNQPKSSNSRFDMRINSLKTDDNDDVTMKLIFKLDYYPEDFPDMFSLYLIMDIVVLDTNRAFEKKPTDDLCVAYMALHYKESYGRLYQELNEQCKKVLGRRIEPYPVTDDEVQNQARIILKNYFGRKKR